MSFLPGGGDPGGREPHCTGDISSPAAGVSMHPLLRLQALRRRQEAEEEEEEEETEARGGAGDGPQPGGLLCVIAELPTAWTVGRRRVGKKIHTNQDMMSCSNINV